MIPANGPPAAPSASTRRVTSGSSTSGGAWCGLIRASITSDPRQPQCFCRVERFHAIHVGRRIAARERDPNEIIQRAGRELRIVDDHDQRKAIDRILWQKSRRKNARPAGRVCGIGIALARDGQHARQRRLRGPKTVGQRQRADLGGQLAARAAPRRRSPAFEPSFIASPE